MKRVSKLVPELCAVARVRDYGGEADSEYNNELVLVAGYDPHTSYFIVERTSYIRFEGRASELLCLKAELEPLNEYAAQVIEAVEEAFTIEACPIEELS